MHFFNHVTPSSGQMDCMLFCLFVTLHLFTELCYTLMHFSFSYVLHALVERFSGTREVKNKQAKDQPERNSLTWARWQAGFAKLSGQRRARHELTEPWSLLGSCTTTWWTTSLCFQHWTLLLATSSNITFHTFFSFSFFLSEGFIPFPFPRLSSHLSAKTLEARFLFYILHNSCMLSCLCYSWNSIPLTTSLVSEWCTIGPDLVLYFTNKDLLKGGKNNNKNLSFPFDVSTNDVHFWWRHNLPQLVPYWICQLEILVVGHKMITLCAYHICK